MLLNWLSRSAYYFYFKVFCCMQNKCYSLLLATTCTNLAKLIITVPIYLLIVIICSFVGGLVICIGVEKHSVAGSTLSVFSINFLDWRFEFQIELFCSCACRESRKISGLQTFGAGVHEFSSAHS